TVSATPSCRTRTTQLTCPARTGELWVTESLHAGWGRCSPWGGPDALRQAASDLSPLRNQFPQLCRGQGCDPLHTHLVPNPLRLEQGAWPGDRRERLVAGPVVPFRLPGQHVVDPGEHGVLAEADVLQEDHDRDRVLPRDRDGRADVAMRGDQVADVHVTPGVPGWEPARLPAGRVRGRCRHRSLP